MKIRPTDANGDMLPVRAQGEMAEGGEAAGLLAAARLRMMKGDWAEDAEAGSPVLEILQGDSFGEDKLRDLEAGVTDVLRKTPGILGVEDVRVQQEARRYVYSCLLVTDTKVTALLAASAGSTVHSMTPVRFTGTSSASVAMISSTWTGSPT